ncbi:acyl-CoA dehydrogenase [Pusillimonas sp.]|uniref:acyl-CoA dehydrogenase n=1 Tax=Pusillimonas sp. TaxID=3040095 RepID=UPI0037CB244E
MDRNWKRWRRRWLTEPLYRMAQGAMPRLSATEQEAIEAGDVWWDAELFSGRPNWGRFLSTPPAQLSAEEQAFLDGPVAHLCGMLDDWDISWNRYDLPPEVWVFLKEQGFFGMIIPKQYGGLGFSAYAHSEVVRRISVQSVTAAVTVMVPNSLGPGELLLQFGTQAQRDHWLPRLANGQEVPSFGLTSAEAGSDAAAMTDTGVICRREVDGIEQLGILLNWRKRYITLSPVATVLGLAFKLYDPDHLVGDRAELGISVALVPTSLPGIKIGRRHLPAMQAFQNGPNEGHDVFVPLDALIGGIERAGQGWVMLMSALAAGRGISLPSLAAAACVFSAHTAGAYARVRVQFGIPIGKFEGVQEKLGRMAANAYMIEAARRFTCAGLDLGHKPSVVSAIMKLHATERMRQSVNDAMDVHAGKAVIDGPSNYLGGLYRALPVGITVEGANIVTRNLIVFGQGAIRAHPYLMTELRALADSDQEAGMSAFDKVIWKHVGHSAKTMLRAIGHAWTGAIFAGSPKGVGRTAPFYRRINRYAAAFSVLSEMTVLSLGGSLKRREMLSARLGDILAELYLLSAMLKRWHDEGQHEADLPLVKVCAFQGYSTIEKRIDDILHNYPSRWLGILLRWMVLPFFTRVRPPTDAALASGAKILLEPSDARMRLVGEVWSNCNGRAVEELEQAFDLVVKAQPLMDSVKSSGLKDWRVAHSKGAINDQQAQALEEAEKAVARVIQVDDFAADAFARNH